MPGKIVEDVKRYLWLHPTVVDPTIDPVELLRNLLAEYDRLAKLAKKEGIV